MPRFDSETNASVRSHKPAAATNAAEDSYRYYSSMLKCEMTKTDDLEALFSKNIKSLSSFMPGIRAQRKAIRAMKIALDKWYESLGGDADA